MRVKGKAGVLANAPVNKIVLPGETVGEMPENEDEQTIAVDEKSQQKVAIGPGLRQDQNKVIVTKPGVLRFKAPNTYWVDTTQKRVGCVKRSYSHCCEISRCVCVWVCACTCACLQNVGACISSASAVSHL